jgi:hypothetical protein
LTPSKGTSRRSSSTRRLRRRNWRTCSRRATSLYTCALPDDGSRGFVVRRDSEFYGFWTYDPDTVGEVVAYLCENY